MIIKLAHSKAESSFLSTCLLKALWAHKEGCKTIDIGGEIMDSVGYHFSAHLLNIGLYIS